MTLRSLDLALELAANAENCLSLSLHPRLRRAALRQAAEEGFAEQSKTRQGNLKIRKVRQLLRDSMRSKLAKAPVHCSSGARQEGLSQDQQALSHKQAQHQGQALSQEQAQPAPQPFGQDQAQPQQKGSEEAGPEGSS